MDVAAGHPLGLPGSPCAILGGAPRLRQPPGRRQQQRQRQVRRRLRQHPRRVAQRHPPCPQRRQIHMVVAHRHRAHNLELRPRRIQQCRVDALRQQAVDPIHPPHPLQQHLARDRRIALPLLHLTRPPHPLNRLLRNVPRHQNLSHPSPPLSLPSCPSCPSWILPSRRQLSSPRPLHRPDAAAAAAPPARGTGAGPTATVPSCATSPPPETP